MMKVLVTAASKHGATAEIAEQIGRQLAAGNLDVTVLPAEKVTTVDGYDAVVLGSGVYAGRWLDSAKKIVDRHGAALAARPVWLFSSGPIGNPPKPMENPTDLPGLFERTGSRNHRLFQGRLAKSDLGLAEKSIVTLLRAPDGDFRQWQQVNDWAASIAQALQASSEATVSA